MTDSNKGEQETSHIIYKLGMAEGQVKALNETIDRLQKDSQWYQARINELEEQVVQLQEELYRRRLSCRGKGYKRERQCVMKGEVACTNCGDCGKDKN